MIGQTISHYEILDKLGQGGMGAVYKARDTLLDRFVALKMLSPEKLADENAKRRFIQEARAASALNHPNIITIYEISAWHNVDFMAMEYVEGRTLRELAKDRVGPEMLVHIGRQVSEALKVAHAGGIVHRDMKPENLMLRADGYVKILDFGIARLVHPASEKDTAQTDQITKAGTLIGTSHYMSPEQARGEVAESASDVFSLGIVFYELASGRHPFLGRSIIETLHAIVSTAVPAPSRLNPEVPAVLDELILRMLAKGARSRPSAAEVQETLAQYGRATSGPGQALVLPQIRRRTVGREKQREELRAAFTAATAGKGLLLCVGGEAGIGKTTLIEDFIEELSASGENCLIARGRCSERLAGAEAYLPFLEAFDNLLRGDSGATAGGAMKLLAPTWYFQVTPETGEATAEWLAKQVKTASQERMKREMHSFLQELSQDRPLLLFFDDLHWADASTIDLLAYLGTKFQGMRMLLVATYRPSDLAGESPFARVKLELQGRGAGHDLLLDFLSREDISRYLELEFPDHRFPQEFPVLIHSRTEGNPLFMVDLLHDLRDRHILAEEKGHWTLTQPIQDFQEELPESIRSMIQRKIARLEEGDRRLLMAASVQGSQFDSAVVARILSLDPADVEERLQDLDRVHDFVRLVGELEFPNRMLDVRYRFVHLLYQNALHAALSPSRRASWSATVAQALLEFHGEKSKAIASDLAFLFETARDFARASEYFLIASRNAVRLFAYSEAVVLAERGVRALETLPETPERARQELGLRIMLGVSVMASKGYAAPQVEKAYARARELCLQLGDTRRLLGVLWGLWTYYHVNAQLRKCLELAEQIAAPAPSVQDPAVLVVGLHARGTILCYMGRVVAGCEDLSRATAIYDLKPGSYASLYLIEPAVTCRGMLGRFQALLGYPDQARKNALEAVSIARNLAHPESLAYGLLFLAFTHQLLGEVEQTQKAAEATLALASEHGLAQILAWASVFRGWAIAKSGQVLEGVAAMQESLAAQQAISSQIARPFCLALLAEALAESGQAEQGLRALMEGLETVERTDERWYEAELHRLRGDVLLLQAAQSEATCSTATGAGEAAGIDRAALAGAESTFLQAHSLARNHDVKLLELRAALSLCEILRRQGRAVEGRDILGETYAWFCEGFDTPYLLAARSLLSEENAAGAAQSVFK